MQNFLFSVRSNNPFVHPLFLCHPAGTVLRLARLYEPRTAGAGPVKHGRPQWIGAAALGGFFGENVLAFVPAVISGAAGIYAITLLADADNDADLTVHPGPVVHIRAGVARALRCGAGGEGSPVLTSEMKEKLRVLKRE
jgi:hypothetical protein